MSEPANVVQFPTPEKKATLGEGPAQVQPVARNSRGVAVAELQRNLLAWGFNPGAADGIYGPKTKAAVAALQVFLGLPQPASGEFDAQTTQAVNADLARWSLTAPLNSRLRANGAGRTPTTAPSFPRAPPKLSTNTGIVPVQNMPTAPTPMPAAGPPPWLWWAVGGLAAVVGTLLLFKSGGDGNQAVGGDDYFDRDDEPALAPVLGDEDAEEGDDEEDAEYEEA